MNTMDQMVSDVSSLISHIALNRYTLNIDSANALGKISVLSLKGHEQLGNIWRYEV